MACGSTVTETVLVEVPVDVPRTVVVERDVIVTVEATSARESFASPPPELEGLCEDMHYQAQLEFYWSKFWEVRQGVATSVEDLEFAELMGVHANRRLTRLTRCERVACGSAGANSLLQILPGER